MTRRALGESARGVPLSMSTIRPEYLHSHLHDPLTVREAPDEEEDEDEEEEDNKDEDDSEEGDEDDDENSGYSM